MNKMQEPEMRRRVPVLSWALVLVLRFSEADSLAPKLACCRSTACVLKVPRALGTGGWSELSEVRQSLRRGAQRWSRSRGPVTDTRDRAAPTRHGDMAKKGRTLWVSATQNQTCRVCQQQD